MVLPAIADESLVAFSFSLIVPRDPELDESKKHPNKM